MLCCAFAMKKKVNRSHHKATIILAVMQAGSHEDVTVYPSNHSLCCHYTVIVKFQT